MMNIIKRVTLILTTITALLLLTTAPASAQYRGRGLSLGGNHSFSLGISLLAAKQDDLNNVIEDHGDTVGTNYKVSTFGSGYEFIGQYAYRFDRTMYSMVFRPSYATQSTDGDCGTQSCKYDLTGFTFFPMLRITPLENGFIQFYMQAGVGYGRLSGEVKQGPNSVKFSGSSFGTITGVGANFCFTESHCVTVEGNLRYLSFDRNIADSVTGTFGAGSGFSQVKKGEEVERDNKDLATTLSGIQGLIAYTMNF